MKSNGLGALDDYPYTKKGGQCRKDVAKVVTSSSLGTLVREKLNGNEERLKDIVAAVGPVGIAIDAADSFSNYESGVYNNPKCSRSVNHAVS